MIAAIDGVRAAGERLLGVVGKGSAPAINGWLPDAVKDWFETDHHSATADIVKGAVAGLAGGLAGSWAMNQVHSLMSAGSEESSPERNRPKPGTGSRENGPAATEQQGKRATDSNTGQEPATTQVAEAVSRTVAQRELTSSEKSVAGPAVHYGYGAAVGGLYGGLVETVPLVGAGFGTAYGTALWLVGDEIAVPALGLGKPPTETEPSEHAKALAAHLIYGLTLEAVRRLVRRIL